MRLVSSVALCLLAALAFALTTSATEPSPTATFDPTVARRISIPEVQRRLAAGEKIVLVDARSSLDGDAMIKDAVHVPDGRLAEWAKGRPKDALIVAYCA